MNRIVQTTRDLGYLVELVVKGMIGIFIVYFIAKTLIELVVGPEAAKIISVILGLAIFFAIIVSKRIRREISEFGKG